MATTLRPVFAFLVVVFVHSPALGQSGPYSPAGLERLKEDILAIMDEAGIPGASIALVTGDEIIWAGGLGKADVAGDVDATAESLFRVGSVSKSFTALALLRLVEQDQLDLDAPIRALVPELEYTNPWAETHPITVAHLLEHTTGFDDMHFVEIGKVDDPDITLEAGLAFHPHSRISRWPPGTHMSYANSGPPIAALVLEAVTGQEFEAYAGENVFEPLGMVHSTFRFPREPEQLARGYNADGTEANYDHIIVRPSGGLNSSSLDMSNYLRMMINRGQHNGRQVFRPETIERMERPTTTLAARAGHDFGYGLGNHASIVNGHQFHGHGGSITGFIATTAYSPDLGVGYFVSINTLSGRLNDIADLIAKFLTAERATIESPSVSLDDGQLQRVAGYYQAATPRLQLTNVIYRFAWLRRVWVAEGRLYENPLLGGATRELIPVSEDSFRTEGQPVATLFLVSDEQGTTYLQSGFEGHMRKISALSAWFQPLAAGLAQLLMLSALLFGSLWLAARVFGKMSSIPSSLVLPQFLAPLSLYGSLTLTVVTVTDVSDLSRVSVAGLSLFLGTLVFALLSLYLAIRLVRPVPAQAGPVVRNWSRLVSIACVGTAIFLMSEGIIGVRLWSY